MTLSFYSFNGAFGGRFPHAFVRWEGTLSDGTPVDGNAGFTARSISPGILLGSVEHTIWVEEDKYMSEANRHFELTIDDATYAQAFARRWRPGERCRARGTTSTAATACTSWRVWRSWWGLRADDPGELTKKPKAYLNHLIELNPQLGAVPVASVVVEWRRAA